MDLLDEITHNVSIQERRVLRMTEKVHQWLNDINNEHRLGLPPIDALMENDGVSSTARRIHVIYDPSSGRVEKVSKTSILSRPPSEYTEANASQVSDVLRYLERISPRMADALVNGDVNIWVPRNLSSIDKQRAGSIRQLGLKTIPIAQTRHEYSAS
jgi:hypothetical protein